jgi:hypothetical protein
MILVVMGADHEVERPRGPRRPSDGPERLGDLVCDANARTGVASISQQVLSV